MSDIVDETLKGLAEEKEMKLKQKELRDRKINADYERMKENDHNLEVVKATSFGALTSEQVENLKKESSGYIESAKGCMRFICESFDKIVPMFPRNLIVIGALTGRGKTTCVANIALTNILQKDKITGKPKRTLVITNETPAEDVYNTVTCLLNGWQYANHDQFTEQQKIAFEKGIEFLSAGGKLTVLDSGQIEGLTTTVEGLETIFSNMMRDKNFYDCVIIDYYQEFSESTKRPDAGEYEVQAMVTRVLEKYRKVYPAPIFVLAQLKPYEGEGEDTRPFKVKMEGRKLLCNKATMIMEMVANFDNRETLFVIHKSRYGQSLGQGINTGFENGRFIKLTDEFKKKIQNQKQQRADAETTKGLQQPETKKEDEDGTGSQDGTGNEAGNND